LFVAQVGLAIASLSNFNGVAPAVLPEREMSPVAQHVMETQLRLEKLWANELSQKFRAQIDKDFLIGMREGVK
jgi:hypothetical protein